MGANPSIDRTDYDIVLFDGVCNLCQRSVQIIIRYDFNERLKFASLQSEFAKKLLLNYDIDASALDTILLVRSDVIYKRSRAALEIARYLSGGWPMFYGLIIFPAFLRDIFYNFIAANRYRFFGKQSQCMLPTPALASRFLE